MVPFERALVSSYCRPSIVTFPLSLRVSEIDLLPLLCSSTPLFPTAPLVSTKFPHVPLAVGGWPLGYEERRYWANCSCNYFPRFPTYVSDPDQPTSQTDRQTDRRSDDMQSQYRALHYSAPRGNKHLPASARLLHTFHGKDDRTEDFLLDP